MKRTTTEKPKLLVASEIMDSIKKFGNDKVFERLMYLIKEGLLINETWHTEGSPYYLLFTDFDFEFPFPPSYRFSLNVETNKVEMDMLDLWNPDNVKLFDIENTRPKAAINLEDKENGNEQGTSISPYVERKGSQRRERYNGGT